MKQQMNHQSLINALLLFTCLILIMACGENEAPSGQSQMPPLEVDVAKPLKKLIIDWDEYTGRFEALETVQVHARVTGHLRAIKFKDGQFVSKGDILFEIDPRPFQYEVQRANAQYALAEKEFERAKTLRASNAISEEDADRRAEELKISKAVLNEARLQLEFTQVVSPINGKISRDFVSVGNMVSENETILTRIVSVDPIHFYFEANQNQLMKYIRMDRAGERPGSDTTANPIFIKLPDETDFMHEGKMDFVDNIVDPGTGTMQGRAIVPNPDAIIYPGLFGRARLLGSGEYEAILLPAKSINTDQSRKFVYIIDQENKAQRAYIELGNLREDGNYVIKSGLKGDEMIVINGIQRIRFPDQPVTPIKISIDGSQQ